MPNRDRDRDDDRARERKRRRMRAAEAPDEVADQPFPRRLYSMREGVWDTSGVRAFQLWLRVRNRAAAGAILLAARGPELPDGTRPRKWSSPYARNVCMLGLFALELMQPASRMRAGWRTRWKHSVTGVTQPSWGMLLERKDGSRPGRSTISGYHRAYADLINAQFGYADALDASGFWYWFQRRQCAPGQGDGPTCAEYWIVSHSAYLDGDALAEVLQLCKLGDNRSGPERVKHERAFPARAPP